MKVCSVPGCPNIQPEPKCLTHRREAEQARGSSAARGYDAEHQAKRARWEPIVATGEVPCWRCGHRIRAGQPFDLGHDDTDRTKYRGPEHVACNRATRARRAS